MEELERSQVLDALHSEQYVDKSPYQVYASLLDKGEYLCSVRTMYRILSDENEVRERRQQRQRSYYEKPELLATKPNQVWSWDITKLKGPVTWTYYYLYVIIDIFSRYVVGWMIANRETAELAKYLISETCEKQQVESGTLTIHADRGSPMKAKTVALLMSDLGITKSHSRPSVSNDNPYSESQFKTLKYSPMFPDRFGCIEDARSFCQNFFQYYNKDHYHWSLGLLTPESVHYREAEEIVRKRSKTLLKAYERNPNRFVKQVPTPANVPNEVWINKPYTQGTKS